jgi:hypothetical protein
MIDQYRLRLRDGTVLTVDHGGLRTWLMDERTLVQPPGSVRWRPLKKFLAENPTAPTPPPRVDTAPPPIDPAVRRVEPAVPPVGSSVSLVESIAEAVEPSAPRVEPSRSEPDLPPIPLVAAAESRPVLAPLAEATAASKPRRDDAIPIIPFKAPEDRDRPAAARPAAPSPSLHDVAAAEVERHGGTEASWQWTPPKARPSPVAEPHAIDAEEVLSASHRERAADEHRAAVYPPAMRRARAPQEEPVAIRLAPLDPAEEEAVLEELELVEEVQPAPTLPEALAQAGARGQEIARQLFERGQALAPSRARVLALMRAWASRVLPAAAAVLVLAIVVATRSTWMGLLSAPRPAAKTAPAAPPPATMPTPPPLPPEVQAAVTQLPHLSVDTIQLVIKNSGPVVPEPHELFRRAWIAANRGTSGLSDAEAEELRSIKKAVLFSLRAADRDRVRAYDRVSVSVDLLVLEDGKVMAMFTRGVRALPAARRERLQELLGKAITTALAPPFELRR